MNPFVESRVAPLLEAIHSYAWDGCHKIYINFSYEITKEVENLGYEVVKVTEQNIGDVIPTISEWWEKSCWLKFISGIKDGPNGGEIIFDIIGQDEVDPYEEDGYDGRPAYS